MPRKILHMDLDAFFCAVEELHNPALRGKPFAVGGRPETRGVVASCSYAARQFGVHSAMPMAQALRHCQGLVIVESRHETYGEYSRQVMEILQQLTPLVEPVSIDEAFLDVSDLPEAGQEIASRLQARIRQELGLPCSLGVATNKLVAKIATDTGKATRRGPTPPNAITVVPPGQEAAFLAPLPVKSLWGVGPKTAAQLESMGIHTIGDLTGVSEAVLIHHFGKNGADLARHAQGIDDSLVVTSHETKSISHEVTFDRDVRDGERLRQESLNGTTVRLKLRWSDFTTLSRQTTLAQPTDQDGVIFSAVYQLFEKAWVEKRPVRLIGVGVSGLSAASRQLSLWDSGQEKEHRLLEAVDELRERFGAGVIRRGDRLKPPRKGK